MRQPTHQPFFPHGPVEPDQSEANPCPHCGGPGKTRRLLGSYDRGQCPKCMIEMQLAIWNSRPIEDELIAELQQVKKERDFEQRANTHLAGIAHGVQQDRDAIAAQLSATKVERDEATGILQELFEHYDDTPKFRETSDSEKVNAVARIILERDWLKSELAAIKVERNAFKNTIDAIITASGWDGVDCGIAQFIEQIRVERDEANQWIDSEPRWKAEYNRNYLALAKERDSLRAEVEKLRAAVREALSELMDRYDGAPDSGVLWLGSPIQMLVGALSPQPEPSKQEDEQ